MIPWCNKFIATSLLPKSKHLQAHIFFQITKLPYLKKTEDPNTFLTVAYKTDTAITIMKIVDRSPANHLRPSWILKSAQTSRRQRHETYLEYNFLNSLRTTTKFCSSIAVLRNENMSLKWFRSILFVISRVLSTFVLFFAAAKAFDIQLF